MRKPEDIKIGKYTLKEIIERHQHWLDEDCEDWQSMRANLADANLSNTDLSGVNLTGADLRRAILSHANLSKAILYDAELIDANLNDVDLSGANLGGVILCDAELIDANLSYANLCNADLNGANLTRANLSYADLSRTNLHGAYLRLANLVNAELIDADLSDANLSKANLSRANLTRANLSDANLTGANLSYCILIVASGNLIQYRKGKMLTENIIGYKKCKNDIIVTLEIPRGAIVFSISGNKCRTNKVKVISIEGADRAYSIEKYMSYYIGDEITIYDFNCEYNIECGTGIHFFMTKEEAEQYEY